MPSYKRHRYPAEIINPLGIVMSTSTADPASCSKSELLREIRQYRLGRFAVILPLLVGTLVAIVTPVELGRTALFAGAAGMLVLSILHNYVNIPQMAAAVRKDSQQWKLRAIQERCQRKTHALVSKAALSGSDSGSKNNTRNEHCQA